MIKTCLAVTAWLAAAVWAPAQALTFFTSEAAFNAAVPSRTLLQDFSGVGPKDTPIPSLVTPTATYTGLAGVPFPNVYVFSPGANNFGAGANPTTQYILTANGDEQFNILFNTPHLAVGFDAFFNGLGPVVINVYGAFDALIGAFPFNEPAGKGFIGFTHNDPIHRFTFQSVSGGQINTGLTDIVVDAPRGEVPVPGALPLFVSGLALLGVVAHRRKRKRVV